jgi:hypothetical protein
MKRIAVILIIGFFLSFSMVVNGQIHHASTKEQGALMIEGKVTDLGKIGLFANVQIEFKKGSYKFDAMHIFSDSSGFFQIILKRGVKHKFIIYADGFKPKVLEIDTRKSGKSKNGYVIPIEVVLEKGKKEVEGLTPVVVIFYDKETDSYKSKMYN